MSYGKVANSYRFTTPKGAVWAIVTPIGDGRALIAVSEESCGLSAARERDGLSERTLSLMDRAKNLFGVRTMLRILRSVAGLYPEVHEWVVDRVSGSNTSTLRTVRV